MATSRAGSGDEETAPPPPALDPPATAPRPGESEAHAAERIAAASGQDPWGEPEDRPDHAGNEAHAQRDETAP
jgi:hypothetical protein